MSAHNEQYSQFLKANQDLLECYAHLPNPLLFKVMSPTEQRDFCYTERVRVEETLIKGRIRASDFFAH